MKSVRLKVQPFIWLQHFIYFSCILFYFILLARFIQAYKQESNQLKLTLNWRQIRLNRFQEGLHLEHLWGCNNSKLMTCLTPPPALPVLLLQKGFQRIHFLLGFFFVFVAVLLASQRKWPLVYPVFFSLQTNAIEHKHG